MSEAMELSNKTLESIGSYVRQNLPQWIREVTPQPSAPQTDPVLLERVVRVEEELRSQREIIQHGFGLMEKRFDQIDKRFEQVDKRFEEMRADTNARFEQVDKRFEEMRVDTNARFEQSDRHMSRWMTLLSIILGLMTVAVTVTNLL